MFPSLKIVELHSADPLPIFHLIHKIPRSGSRITVIPREIEIINIEDTPKDCAHERYWDSDG